ncbi:MAG: hypothetical protein R8P61_05975 [Bacteroidia bacterium]|nr:hypothetical protein [Bacteroidia bacterium]
MRIVSKFHDYYDSVQASGQDQSCVYVRKEDKSLVHNTDTHYHKISQLKNLGEAALFSKERGPEHQSILFFRELTLGYCGKLYPIFQFVHFEGNKAKKLHHFYKPEDAEAYFQTVIDDYPYDGHYLNYWGNGKKLGLDHAYSYESRYDIEVDDLFHYFQVPLFMLPDMPYDFSALEEVWGYNHFRRGKDVVNILLNPCLRRLEFFRIKDPYSCFQDIYQYINGVLGNTENIETKMSDQDKIQQHGFDQKYGFRKRPGNKKRRKNKK